MNTNVEQFTDIKSLINCLGSAMDLTSPESREYYQRITYASCELAAQAGYVDAQLSELISRLLYKSVLSLLKDADYSFHDMRLSARNFQGMGTTLFKLVPDPDADQKVLRAGTADKMIDLAEEIVTAMDDNVAPLEFAKNFTPENKYPGEVINALEIMRTKDYAWMNLFYGKDLFGEVIKHNVSVSLDDTIRMTEAISFLIDFRSPFTAMHSAGVAASAVELARYAGMNETEQKKMRIAGNLHDLGKLKVPTAILEKNGKLTDEEFDVIKEHVFYTYQILREAKGFDEIAEWAGFHHEKLNGNGYPFGLSEEEIPLGTRIMTVADIFSAITEVRPYRKGMPKDKVIKIMKENAERGEISEYLVEILVSHYDEIDNVRAEVSKEAGRRYFEAIEETEKAEEVERRRKEAEAKRDAIQREKEAAAEAVRKARISAKENARLIKEAKKKAEVMAKAESKKKAKEVEKKVEKETEKVKSAAQKAKKILPRKSVASEE